MKRTLSTAKLIASAILALGLGLPVIATGDIYVNQNSPCPTFYGGGFYRCTDVAINGRIEFWGPDRFVADGIDHAHAGTVIRIQSGSYNEQLTINKAVTIVAEHGAVTIGR